MAVSPMKDEAMTKRKYAAHVYRDVLLLMPYKVLLPYSSLLVLSIVARTEVGGRSLFTRDCSTIAK